MSMANRAIGSVYKSYERKDNVADAVTESQDKSKTLTATDIKQAQQGDLAGKRAALVPRIVTSTIGGGVAFLTSGGNLKVTAAGAGTGDKFATSVFGGSRHEAYTRKGLDTYFSLKEARDKEYTAEAVQTGSLAYSGGKALDSHYGNMHTWYDNTGNEISYSRHLAMGGDKYFDTWGANWEWEDSFPEPTEYLTSNNFKDDDEPEWMQYARERNYLGQNYE